VTEGLPFSDALPTSGFDTKMTGNLHGGRLVWYLRRARVLRLSFSTAVPNKRQHCVARKTESCANPWPIVNVQLVV